MNTEFRFLLAIVLMIGVIVGTNAIFGPPVTPPPAGAPADTAAAEGGGAVPSLPGGGEGGPPRGAEGGAERAPGDAGEVAIPGDPPGEPAADEPPEEAEAAAPVPPERIVRVESPIYRHTFSSHGARLLDAELSSFRSLRRDGPVQLVPEGSDALGTRLVVGRDTLDLRRLPFEVEPADGIVLEEGGPAERLRFTYTNPDGSFAIEIAYTFEPGTYAAAVEGRVTGVDRALVLTELGSGLAYAEADSAQEAAMMAWVGNHVEEGIDSHDLRDIEEREVFEGPFHWAALKSKFFSLAVLPAEELGEGREFLGGVIVEEADGRPLISVAQNLSADGRFDHLVFTGPMEYARLQALGDDLEEVNPYGWRWLRPLLRPIVAGIIWVLNFLHDTLNIGYGWVLIIFGVLMRVVLWPLNQKAMRAQITNMQVQPLLKEIQKKHKDNPERLQKEMMRLYKEHGFNPLAGCLPMLLPWPVLIALFFVFQNTIELRGVEFLWLPDLSAKDPFYILPVFLAASMFVVQYISYRSMDQDNPQMKMMMWLMPPFLGFIFMQFASGLNLYYATANVAMIPQQYLIAKERKKARQKAPLTLDGD